MYFIDHLPISPISFGKKSLLCASHMFMQDPVHVNVHVNLISFI